MSLLFSVFTFPNRFRMLIVLSGLNLHVAFMKAFIRLALAFQSSRSLPLGPWTIAVSIPLFIFSYNRFASIQCESIAFRSSSFICESFWLSASGADCTDDSWICCTSGCSSDQSFRFGERNGFLSWLDINWLSSLKCESSSDSLSSSSSSRYSFWFCICEFKI